MYFFIVNPAAGKGKLHSIETKLIADLKKHGILGDWAKTTGRSDVKTLVKQAEDRGFSTIVSVGGDGLIGEILNDITNYQVVLGTIPLGASNKLAHLFGIEGYKQAPATLAARRVETVTLSEIGSHPPRLFINSVEISEPGELMLKIDGAYQIRGRFKTMRFSRDFGHGDYLAELTGADGAETRIRAASVELSKPVKAAIDGELYEEPLNFSISNKKIRIIVGRDRTINV